MYSVLWRELKNMFFSKPAVVAPPQPSDLSDLEIVARTIWGEARNQGDGGMMAVACVIQNRARKGGWWGNTPRQVCMKPSQFSCWNKFDPNRAKMLSVTNDDRQYQMALKLAGFVISEALSDVTGGATSYQVRGTDAWWSRGQKPIASIGVHDFYKV